MSEPASLLVAPETPYLEVTFSRLLHIWWAYFWRHMLFGCGAVLTVEFLEAFVGLDGNKWLQSFSVVVVMAIVSLLVFGIALHKQFPHFSIRLVPTHAPAVLSHRQSE
jgi:hypothetical protein